MSSALGEIAERVESSQATNSRIWRRMFLGAGILLITTMMLPEAFGLQSFTQWGGMYANRHCQVRFTGTHREIDDQGRLQTWAGTPKTFPAWFVPMHNEETCVAWARKHYCELRTVDAVYVTLRQKPVSDGIDVCTLDGENDDWFSHHAP
jgi:hypothetical protein